VTPGGERIVSGDLVHERDRPGRPSRLPGKAIALLSPSEGLVEVRGDVPRMARVDLRTGKELGQLPRDRVLAAGTPDGRIAVLAEAHQGPTGNLWLWNVESSRRIGDAIRVRNAPAWHWRFQPINRSLPTFQFAGDGRLAVEGQDDDESAGITILDGRTGAVVQRLTDPTSLKGPAVGSFAPGGGLLATFHERDNRILDIWDVELPRKLASLPLWEEGESTPLARKELDRRYEPVWATTGRLVTSQGKVWEVVRLNPTYPLRQRVSSLHFAADGRRLAVGGDSWDVRWLGGQAHLGRPAEDDEEKRRRGIFGGDDLAAFAEAGLWTVKLPRDPSSRLPVKERDSAGGGTTFRPIASWQAHDHAVSALAFSPDGRVLVSAGLDGTLKVWQLAAIAEELQSLGLGWRLP
jgi:WD40 repeat protein